jgi:hypothetical protein
MTIKRIRETFIDINMWEVSKSKAGQDNNERPIIELKNQKL